MLQLVLNLSFILSVGGAFGWAVFMGPDRWRPSLGRKPMPSHRPDYAKIRRLELELGLRDPDPPPITEPVVPMFKPTLTPLEQAGEHWVNDVNAALRQAQAEAAKWQQCPVCLRCHAGRCAG